MSAYKYPMARVSYNRWKFRKWHRRFGTELILWMDRMVIRESLRVGKNISPIKIHFVGNIDSLPENAQLEGLMIRESSNKWGIFGRLLGKKYSGFTRLIVLKASPSRKTA